MSWFSWFVTIIIIAALIPWKGNGGGSAESTSSLDDDEFLSDHDLDRKMYIDNPFHDSP